MPTKRTVDVTFKSPLRSILILSVAASSLAWSVAQAEPKQTGEARPAVFVTPVATARPDSAAQSPTDQAFAPLKWMKQMDRAVTKQEKLALLNEAWTNQRDASLPSDIRRTWGEVWSAASEREARAERLLADQTVTSCTGDKPSNCAR